MRCVALIRLCLAAWVIAAVPAKAQDDTQALRQELDAMRQAVERLQRRLDTLEQGAGRAAPSVAAATAAQASAPVAAPADVADIAASALPQRASVADPSTAASRPDSAAGPTDPGLAGFFAVPGTDTLIRLGGYAKLDAIADSRASGNEDQFIPSSMPLGAPGRNGSNVSMHAKQTRFSVEARRPTTRGNLRFYLENDFFGSSDDYAFRLLHAYGQLGNVYAGYGYSSFMDPDSLPDTLDFAGPGGAAYLLVAGIHTSFAMGTGNTLTIAVEDPDTELVDDASARMPVNRLPDVTLVARMERNGGHLQFGAVLRSLGYHDDEARDREFAGGLQVSGSASVGERDLLLFGVLGGRGLGRYTAELTGSGLDAVAGLDGRLEVLDLRGGFVGYTHYWSDTWRSNLVLGQLTLERNGALASEVFRQSRYGVINLLWSPAASWTMGMELLYGRLEQQGGTRGETARLQGSVQYKFIK